MPLADARGWLNPQIASFRTFIPALSTQGRRYGAGRIFSEAPLVPIPGPGAQSPRSGAEGGMEGRDGTPASKSLPTSSIVRGQGTPGCMVDGGLAEAPSGAPIYRQ
jgi:hypothetical protein